MYHHSESMVYMLEDMQRNANQMEQEVKMMLEQEGRAYGIELDRRKNARDLMEELKAAIAASEMNDATMTWAYIPQDQCNYDCAMPEDYAPYYPADQMLMEEQAAMDSEWTPEEPQAADPYNGLPAGSEPEQT